MFDQLLREYNQQCRRNGEVPGFYGFTKFGHWSLAMTEMLFRYVRCCREYNWKPTILGLVLFPEQIEVGIRKGVIEVD